MNSTQLEITRKWNLIGAARASRIVMDNVEVARLGPGETITIGVSPGRHVLSMRSGTASGPQSIVEFAPGETIRLWSNLGRLSTEDGRPLDTIAGTAVPPQYGLTVLLAGLLNFWIGMTGGWRSPEDSGLLTAFNIFLGVGGVCGVFLGITQLRDMYNGKISRAWEVPVWIGTIAGAIGLLLQFVSFISAGHRY